MPSASASSAAAVLQPRRFDRTRRASPRILGSAASAMLSAIAPFMRRPSSRRFSVTKAMPLRMLRRGECAGSAVLADGDLAGSCGFEAEENARELGSARAHQAEDAEHFAGVEAES